PETFDELRTTLDELKAKGVADSPMTLAMAASEGSVTPWYMLTLAMGGQLFDEDFNPLFTDPESAGYQALQFEVDALQNGWVSPGSVTLDDNAAFQAFTSGSAAIDLASDPGSLVIANDPKQSSIAGDAEPGLLPGIDGPGATFGSSEGVGIPVTAEHKDAARAFIDFLGRTETQIEMYRAGFLPCGNSALDKLAASGDLEGGEVVTKQFALSKPLFPQGAPAWYSQFSSEAQGLLNAAFKGDITVQEALDQLAERATELAQSS
nr:extracellular solute-binding protein [Solirubrobacterales bacterium]